MNKFNAIKVVHDGAQLALQQAQDALADSKKAADNAGAETEAARGAVEEAEAEAARAQTAAV